MVKHISAQHSDTSKELREIYNHIKPTNLTCVPFRTIRTLCELRLNNRIRKNKTGKEEK